MPLLPSLEQLSNIGPHRLGGLRSLAAVVGTTSANPEPRTPNPLSRHFIRVLGGLLDEFGYQPCPTGLMRGSEACSVVAMEIFEE
jgi:hypothetical protein